MIYDSSVKYTYFYNSAPQFYRERFFTKKHYLLNKILKNIKTYIFIKLYI